jgi:hypothetical protein
MLANSAQPLADAAPTEPPPPADSSLEPPPPPPPVEPIRSDSESSDEDDGGQPWHPIHEDTSAPDETELKEIEASTEVSALDHEHWEKRAFPPLEDPEYTAGASGRIEWAIENYNGTREKPNRELVMKSPPVTIGGYVWQIKFYPKGNDSDYLSVYVECLSVEEKKKKQKKEDEQTESAIAQRGDAMETDAGKEVKESAPREEGAKEEEQEEEPAPYEAQHAPLPLLGSKTLPKRKSVAAQVAVVLYNPAEPRVNYSKTCLHRFCGASPDWGWTRFHGPYYDIPHRIRGQRQALLRGDKLAFTGYIRIVEDDTNCLWEHPSNENVWDSFAMTGLQSLALGDPASPASTPGSNIISAIASWLLFKPFRQLLYSFQAPDPEQQPFVQPKPLVSALQKVLYMLRTHVQPGARAVTLEDIMDALEWYGIQERLDKFDVIAIWEYLRSKLEDEFRDTPFVNALEALCGPRRDYVNGVPNYRVSVVGVGTMQEAVNRSTDLVVAGAPLPDLLTIELERQAFDKASRSYVKLSNKVSLDDHINVRGTPYTLYGFVVHKQTLQSYVYQPILRPEGPSSKWYSYSDGREGNMVKCLTNRQAVIAHEGKEGSERITSNDPVAYIAMYVRDDIAESAFRSQPESEEWQVPQWLSKDVAKQQTASNPPQIPVPESNEDQMPEAEKDIKPVEETPEAEEREFQVINSQAFLQHEGPGIFYAYDSKWQSGTSDLVLSVHLKATDGCKEIRAKLVEVVGNIEDPRQVKFWFMDPIGGSICRPSLLGTGKIEYSSGSYDRYADQTKEWKVQDSPYYWLSRRIWVHIVNVADLPELPKEDPPVPTPVEPEQSHQREQSVTAPLLTPVAQAHDATPAVEATNPTPPDVAPHSEDTPMSEPEEPEEPEPRSEESQPEERITVQAPDPLASATTLDGGDAEMVETDAPVLPESSAVNVVISDTAGGDTEMSGTTETIPPLAAQIEGQAPVPLPTDLPTEPVPPPVEPPAEPPAEERPQSPEPVVERPPTPLPPPDEIYFFIKFFDPEKQTLEPKGSYIALKGARVESTVVKILDLPSDKKIELCEEEELISTRPIRGRKSFAQNDLANTATIIYSLPLTSDQRNAIAARAAFADIQPYLAFRAKAQNFPSKLNGHFTHNYFSSQYYKGEIKNGHRHGHGYQIYHSGATYEGTFQLGQRHGHGLYTFQNGDTYDGDWVGNQQHGNGTFIEAATGNTYVGGWKNDKKFGEGVTHWKNAQETERLCRICWEESADAAFYDCGHVVACLGCARQVENCPVCRKRVLSAMKLYYVA